MAVKSLAQSGIVNFKKHGSMLAGYQTNMFHHLETIRLSSTASAVEFTNLGQYSDYQHLQIRGVARDGSTNNNNLTDLIFYPNNNSTANIISHWLEGTGSSAASDNNGSNTFGRVRQALPKDAAGAGRFGGFIIDILDPFDTTKNTTFRAFGGGLANSQLVVAITSTLWPSTDALDSLEFGTITNGLVTGSRFSLYGLKVRA